MILIIIVIIATVFAFVQNSIMFSFSFKEMAILASPLSFLGILIAEIVLIWGGVIVVRRFAPAKKEFLLIAWALLVLGTAELILPVSYFSHYVKHARREGTLNRIEVLGKAVEVLASEHKTGSRFALKYSLQFPKAGHYLTFPAYIGADDRDRVFGNYFRKIHSEYYDENFIYEPNKPYEFIVVFDSGSRGSDFTQEKVNIQICDEKSYFMTCRTIQIDVGELLKASLASNPSPTAHEPAVSADNVWDLAEKGIRVADLRISSLQTRVDSPLEFSFAITNIGRKDIAIPERQLGSLIRIHYAWEPISDSAQRTEVNPGIVRFGNAIAAGGTQFTFQRDAISPGEKISIKDKITFVRPNQTLNPGTYKLHLFLFNNYSTDSNLPVQELRATFSIVP